MAEMMMFYAAIFCVLVVGVIGEFLGIGFWATLVMFVVVLGIYYLIKHEIKKETKRNQKTISFQEWHGEMFCNLCQYTWQSRRSTPPAKCARCSSVNIKVVQVTQYRTVQK